MERTRPLIVIAAVTCAYVVPPPTLVHAAPHRVCLELELGPEMWDASPRPESLEPCEVDQNCSNGELCCTATGTCPLAGEPPAGVDLFCRFRHGDLGEPYGRADDPFVAQRWLLRVHETGGPVQWGWAPLDEDGCTDSFDTEAESFDVYWQRWAVWEHGDQVLGYGCFNEEGVQRCTIPERSRLGVAADAGSPAVTVVVVTDAELGGESQEVGTTSYPFWAATFAEERAATYESAFGPPSTVYVSYDAQPLGTASDRFFGGHPGFQSTGNGYHSKYSAAHEYGHTQTMLVPVPGFDLDSDIDYNYDDEPAHDFPSPEYSAAACFEGLAHLYSVSVWWDLETEGIVRYVQTTDLQQTLTPRAIPRDPPESACDLETPGVTQEWCWASAFREFQIDNDVALPTMFGMIEAAYPNWVASGTTSDFWDGFSLEMETHLGALHDEWEAVAATWFIDV